MVEETKEINRKGKFSSSSIEIKKTLKILEKINFVFTKELRNSSKVISSQKINLKKTINVYNSIKQLFQTGVSLKNGNYIKLGKSFINIGNSRNNFLRNI